MFLLSQLNDKIRECSLGISHQDTIDLLVNLETVYNKINDVNNAYDCFQKALNYCTSEL